MYHLVRLIYLVVTIVLYLTTCNGSQAWADCSRNADFATNPAIKPSHMTGVDPEGRDFDFYSKSVALLIGESGYTAWPVLKGVPADLDRLRAALELGGFNVYGYRDLKGDEIRSVVSCFFALTVDRPDMRVLVFFSGHGATRTILGRPYGYVVPIDAPDPHTPAGLDTAEFRRVAIPLSQFIEWSTESNAKHALFIFDSCFSGAILTARGETDEKAKPSGYVFSDSVNQPLRDFIASGAADQTVPDPSTFSDLLIKVLLGQLPEADSNHDGYLTGTELESYLKGWVPRYVAKQTPVSGPINDSSLNQGDFIFKLPHVGNASAWSPASTSPAGDLSPILIGDTSSSVVKPYEVEALVTTKDNGCSANCEAGAGTYDLTIRVPSFGKDTSVLANVQLRCIGGDCDPGRFKVTNTSLSNDGTTASATIRKWGPQSTWRLSSSLFVASTAKFSQVFDVNQHKIVSIASNAVKITNAEGSEALVDDARTKLLLTSLESDDVSIRRSARSKLSAVLAVSAPEQIDLFIRQLPTASYRYQAGLLVALASLKGGWDANDPTSIDIIASLASSKKTDATVSARAKDALESLRAFGFVSGGAHGASPLGSEQFGADASKLQLLQQGAAKFPLSLRSSSSISLRSSPDQNGKLLTVVEPKNCVRASGAETVSDEGIWVKMSPSPCQ